MELGVKFDSGKGQWHLVPFGAMSDVVDVLTYGARKYFAAYANGEEGDPETGYSHLAHAVCCLLFLLAFERGDVDEDQSNVHGRG